VISGAARECRERFRREDRRVAASKFCVTQGELFMPRLSSISRRASRPFGFTLIELLVVIAIIAILPACSI